MLSLFNYLRQERLVDVRDCAVASYNRLSLWHKTCRASVTFGWPIQLPMLALTLLIVCCDRLEQMEHMEGFHSRLNEE